MELQEIEKKIALGELSAAEVFAEMKQHIQAEEVTYFISVEYVKRGELSYDWLQVTVENTNSIEMMSTCINGLKDDGAENIRVLAFNRC